MKLILTFNMAGFPGKFVHARIDVQFDLFSEMNFISLSQKLMLKFKHTPLKYIINYAYMRIYITAYIGGLL